MISWSTKHTLIAGVGLILIVNLVALTGVYYNRTGEADVTLTMTERELDLPYRRNRDNENSGLSLSIQWNVNRSEDTNSYYSYGSYRWGHPDWLDREKLIELGFNVERAEKLSKKRGNYRRALPRSALLVIEYDGDAYRLEVSRAREYLKKQKKLLASATGKEKKDARRDVKNADAQLKRVKESLSRLFVIDAGLDRQSLRNKYPDRSRYIIARGQIRMGASSAKNKREVYGTVSGLSVDRVNVALKEGQNLEPLLLKDSEDFVYRNIGPPRYAVTLSWGRRLEPWIETISALK